MDRIFDVGYIEGICEELRHSMGGLKAQMDVMENVADNAINAMNQVPSDVMDSSIEAEANSLKSRIANIDIDSFQSRIEECETRVISHISAADSQYREQIDELMCTVNNIKEALTEIREFLKNTSLTMSNSDFIVAYEAMNAKCNGYLEGADVQMDKILASIKGAEKVSTVFSKDPVNLGTGNFICDRTDLEIGGSLPFRFSRFYNSINHRKGVLGKDWNHNYEVRILEERNELVLIREEGKEERFIKTPTGVYTALYHTSGTLSETEGGYVYNTREQVKYYFDKKGYYQKQENLQGINIILYYEESGNCKRLVKVERSTGEFFSLAYDESGYLNVVTDHTGRIIHYKMRDDLLCGVTTPTGYWIKYTYTLGGKLLGIINACGNTIVENEYDLKMRTTYQHFADGSEMYFAYDDEKREVELTERNGSKITYVHDKQYRDIRHIYSDGEERFEYNKLNQKTLFVDKLGNRTQFGYDSKGNLTRIINALGIKTELQYEEHNKPTRIAVNGREKVRNYYDGNGNLVESRDALGNTYCLKYDEHGRANEIVLPDRSETLIDYDNRGNIIKITDTLGNISRFFYDALNRVVQTIDGNGNITQYEYDAAGNVTKVINAEGRERIYEYNECGKVTKLTDFDGNSLYREYNSLNKLSKAIDQQGRETHFTYDVMWNLARVTQPDGSKTIYLYDNNNRLGRIKNANGDIIRYTYDANGNRIGIENEEGNTTKIEYDALRRIKAVIEADGSRVDYDYDEAGNLIEVTDALGSKVQMFYDEAGHLVKEINQAGENRIYIYTSLGKIASITNEAGLVTNYIYESGGRLKEILYPDGSKERYVYDANGNITEYIDKKGYHLIYSYDSLDRVVTVSDSEGVSREYTYDSVGNVTRVTDALGNKTFYEYSLTGKLTKVIDANGNKTEYQYDEKDQLIKISRYGDYKEQEAGERCQVTRYERNLLGKITKITDSLGQSESFGYNKRGQLAEKLDKEGYLTRYDYTVRGDVSSIQYADGREVKLSYNPLRQLQEIEDWLGITRIETDVIGRVIKVIGPDKKEVSYNYDTVGRRKAIIYPDNTMMEYKYDTFGRLSELIQGEKSITYGYDATGYLNKKSYPNGMETTYGYTIKGQIESLIHSNEEGVIDQYIYGYDVIGNKTSIEKHRRNLESESGIYTYAYDVIGRLESVAKDGELLRNYTYDAYGNRTSITEAGSTTRYSYNGLNQLISKSNSKNDTVYRYDRRGNLKCVLENGQMKNEYVYGAINRLEETRNAQGEISRYIYNGLGYRVGKETEKSQIEGMTMGIIENSLDPVKNLERQNFNPTVKVDYVIDITRDYYNLLQTCEGDHTQTYLWSEKAAEMLKEGGNTESYYLQDDLGSTIRLIDGKGILRDSYGYDEFGRDLYGNQGAEQPFGYTGYQYDNVAGTYFAQAREYLPDEGRFVAADVVEGNIFIPQTQNRYKYCLDQPLCYIDPSGCTEEETSIQRTKLIEWDDTPVEEVILQNSYGYIIDGLSIGNEILGASIKREIVSAVRSNNIGVGIWKKYVSQELDDAARMFGSSADDVVKGLANTTTEGIFPKALKKLGYVGIALDVGIGVKENLDEGSSVPEIASDAFVDMTFSVGTMMAAGETAAWAGSLAGGVVGAISGFVIGIGIYVLTDGIKIKGKTVRQHIKDSICWLFGWN